MTTRKTPHERYADAAHAMQSGVAMKMQWDPSETSPKHMRVGINAALSSHDGLARLLIEKGVITEDEYTEAIADAMERERDSYQKEVSDHFGGDTRITLA